MSSEGGTATARAPKRERGKQRVAALSQAAAEVFAERGFEAATMTEIAARASAPIGSLYQFFPSKESLADMLVQHYLMLIKADLDVLAVIAGIATPLLVEVLELALSIDDPSGAISVHGVAGLWGLLAAGLFAPQSGQLTAQLVGIATLLGLVLPGVYLVFALLNRVVPFRVDPDGERIGMDLHELGGGAYPEFVIHRDESYR